MPVLLQDSGNSKIQPGAPGYFEAAPLVPLLEVPSAVDRSMGDIHPLGNPHVTLDAHNIAIDRKSTRLNSSHRCISYAVFCLKKKKKQKTPDHNSIHKEQITT